MNAFEVDERLGQDSELVTQIGLCELRLMKDARWPWLVLVPQRADACEIFDLTPLDQTMLTFEINLVADALKRATRATKINVGALGNIVRQLHIHVIARSEGDPNWPGPVWGFGTAESWTDERKATFTKTLLEHLNS